MKILQQTNHSARRNQFWAIVYLFFLLGIFCTRATAGELRQFELNDGSVINGEIVSFKDGVYTIKSNTLGSIKIKESKIQTIRSKPQAEISERPEKQSNKSVSTQLQTLQKSMMDDEQVMNMIISLQNDPDFQEILKDPAIINAVNSGDINTLISNPKFMKLLNNPKFQKIKKEVVK